MPYATVQEMRDEGVADPPYDDDRVQLAIDLATLLIDKVTGWWFEPRSIVMLIDGRGHDTLFLGIPIVEVTKVETKGSDTVWTEVDIADLEIYNRHLSGQMHPEDDRFNPKIVRAVLDPWRRRLEAPFDVYWYKGEQNVRVTGKFGFTDYDINEPEGITPELIKWACRRLAMRELPGMVKASWDEGHERQRIQMEKTRDQAISMRKPYIYDDGGGPGAGVLTGDPTVDAVLSRYKRPMAARGV